MIEFTPEVTLIDYINHCLLEMTPTDNGNEYLFGFKLDGQEFFDKPLVPKEAPQEAVAMSSFDLAKRTFNLYWSRRNAELRHIKATLH